MRDRDNSYRLTDVHSCVSNSGDSYMVPVLTMKTVGRTHMSITTGTDIFLLSQRMIEQGQWKRPLLRETVWRTYMSYMSIDI